MHSIRTDFGFNLLRSASKLKRGVIKGTGGCFWFSVFVDFSSPIFFVGFFLLWILMGTLSVNRFQSNLFYILYDIRLSSTFLWTFFFNVVFCVCSLLIFVLSTQCQYYMNYWTHTPFNCWQNRPDQWVYRNGKKIYIINYIGLHSFVKCDQKNLFNRKKYFWWTVTRTIVWKMSFSLRV